MGRKQWGKPVFRGTDYYKSVFVGKRTIKDGECAAVWNWNGQHKEHVGPKLVYLFHCQVRFLERFVASQHQYLKVQRRDGYIEHLAGPQALFLNPTKHEAISVLDATVLDSTEVILLYSEGSKEDASKVVKGPAVVVPSTTERILSFNWIEEEEDADPALGGKKLVKKTRTKLSLIAQSLPVSVKAKTADDANVTIKLVLRFQPQCLKTMCACTLDPLSDLKSAISADAARMCKRFEYVNLTEATQPLSTLDEYPELKNMAASIGFKVLGVAFIGYDSSKELGGLLSTAIESRASLQLKREKAQQEHELQDMQLNAEISRLKREQDRLQLVHRSEMEQAKEKHAHTLEMAEKAHEQKVRHMRVERESELAFYEQLKTRAGVDVTQVLVAKEGKLKEKAN